ncbi:unnamed protein product [Thlaspi arvense]|uniref:Reverse transcriptase zinc-binding domain-containing protein n=1 Tax=Thlaspi arvense TaxID=13288 RepID=A0AAU9T485_THLAR|nr:unnamed protein product [Thlaspi arvense]
MSDATRFSKPVRSMLQLKHVLVDLLRCAVGNGETASFWYDSWNDMGKLINVFGMGGPCHLQIPREATVKEATRNGSWYLPPARSRKQKRCKSGPDVYLWRNASGLFVTEFSSKATWNFLRTRSLQVNWSSVIWFKEAIPRCSFIVWLALLARLPTRDRLRRWGIMVPGECVLCSQEPETLDHLFFGCSFSSGIWGAFSAGLGLQPSQSLLSVAGSISGTPALCGSAKGVLARLLFQERNSRIFTSTFASMASTKSVIDRTIRDCLFSFPAANVSSPSLLELYFLLLSPAM